MLSAEDTTALREALRAGLSVVTEVWSYQAKDWIPNVHAADIDNDGDFEIVACSREGRVRVFDREGNLLWDRVVGSKAWVGAAVGIHGNRQNAARIIAGTRDGKVYVLDQAGNTLGKDGRVFGYDEHGIALERDEELKACRLDTGAVIRQIYADPAYAPYVIIGSQDGYVYALNYVTGDLHWKFQADGWVRGVWCGDINGDGRVEIIVGSNENTLYVLDDRGIRLYQKDMGNAVHAVYAADVDGDGKMEILVATDDKDLAVLTPELQVKWRHPTEHRLLSLHVADINRDGHPEIIAGSEDTHFYVFSGQGKILWRHFLGYRVYSVYAVDFDNDGQVEILAGAGDSKVYAYRVHLVKDLESRIRKRYQKLEAFASELETLLPPDELHLLQDILKYEIKQHAEIKQVTIERAEECIAAGKYEEALAVLLRLEQQKAQVLWSRGKREELGTVHSVCFGRMKDGKRTIVIGTNQGGIRTFNARGRLLGSVEIGERVLEVQTGVIERGRSEEIVICTSNHNVYTLPAALQREKRQLPLGYETSCIYVSGGNRRRPSEVLIGSEKMIHIYGDGLREPSNEIALPEGIRLVHAHSRAEDDKPEIIAGSTNRWVYAFKRTGASLWEFEVWDRVQAIAMKDIDGDGQVEVIVGAEDRNVHVLDSQGDMLWRYYLPHSVLALQVFDVDQDAKEEILVGCADGYLYVLNRDGDLLWKYHATDRIRAIGALDLDEDGCVEIVVGSEDELEVLRVVDQQPVRDLIEDCLSALQKRQAPGELYRRLLDSPDPTLRSFALLRLVSQESTEEAFTIIDLHARDNAVKVRKAVIQAVVARYSSDRQRAYQLLNQLAQDTDYEVKMAFIEQMPMLMKIDWKHGLAYLEHYFAKGDRWLRRAVVRQLDQRISQAQDRDEYREIFALLFRAAQDGESRWVRQEAARALAHLLDHHYSRLIFYVHLFIVQELQPEMLAMIGRYASYPLVQKFVYEVLSLLADVQEGFVLDILRNGVNLLKDMVSLEFGKDTLKIYEEFYRLFMFNTIDDVAYYRCSLSASDFSSGNDLAPLVLSVFQKLNSITRNLNIYLKREGIYDRLASLLDAQQAIDEVSKFVEDKYANLLIGLPIRSLPDHRLFELLLKRWQAMILAQLNDLRGKAELFVELQTKRVPDEELVGILFKVWNKGRGSADNVKVSLLYGDDYEVISSPSIETETLVSRDALPAEFTIKPCCDYPELRLEVIYDDAEGKMKMVRFADRLELENVTPSRDFRFMHNPYSTGTPIHSSEMFYGRDDDVAVLRDNLTGTSAQTVMLLYGQRRTGKTTLLLHLVHSSELNGHIPVLIDMQGESYDINAVRLLHNLAYYIARTLNEKGYTLPLPEQEAFIGNPTFAFNNFLDEVDERLQEQQLIILIDEFEVLEAQIQKERLRPEILTYLRSVMQHHHRINFLLAGTHRIDQMKGENWSIFFNIARQHRLSKLSAKGAENLIKQPVEGVLEYGPYTVEKIRGLTADLPYFIHLLCRTLVDYCNERRRVYVTLNDINAVMRETMQACIPHFEWLWEQLTYDERLALALITELGRDEGRWLSTAEIEERHRYHRIPYDRERLYACIKSLSEADIVEIATENVAGIARAGERYRIPAGLLRMWLLKERPLRRMSAEFVPAS